MRQESLDKSTLCTDKNDCVRDVGFCWGFFLSLVMKCPENIFVLLACVCACLFVCLFPFC